MKGNPRYALVRVDGTSYCPSRYEKINKDFVCAGLPYCYKCRYGDTKEQMEKKIITAIERAGIDYVQLSKEEIAKEIVKFLGVEE